MSKICTISVTIFILLTVVIPATGFTGDKELLKKTANEFSANLDRLKTWQGQAEIVDTLERNDNKSHLFSKSKINFVLDRDADALRWTWTDIKNEPDGKENTKSALNGMMKNGLIYRFSIPPNNRVISQVQVIPQPDDPMPIRGRGGQFNPMHYLKQMSYDTYGRLMWYYENGEALQHPVLVKKNGTMIVLRVTIDEVVNEYTFDTSKNCNLVKYYAKDSIVEEDWTIDFEKKGNMYIPISAKRKATTKREGYDEIDMISVRFIDNIVNAEIPADEFTLEKLGVRPGDIIYDHRTNLSYEYKPEMRIADAKVESSAVTSPSEIERVTNASDQEHNQKSSSQIAIPQESIQAKNNKCSLLIATIIGGIAGVIVIGIFILIKVTRRKTLKQ